jgi:hypothetical protein
MDCLNNNRLDWYRTKDVEPPEGMWLWTIEPAYKLDKKTYKLVEVLPKATAPDRNSWNAKTKKWSFHNSGLSNNLYWTYPVYPESL